MPGDESRSRRELSEDTEALIRRYQGGERGAGEQLFARYLPRVRKLVLLGLGREQRARLDVDDLVQESMLAALKSIDDFEAREEGRWIHWLATIVRHRVLQGVHAAQAAPRELDLSPAAGCVPRSSRGYELAANTTLVPEKVARGEERELVEEALAALPQAQRDVLLLRQFAGCSWKGIAEELGHPSANAAIKHYARARAALAALLARRMSESPGTLGARDHDPGRNR